MRHFRCHGVAVDAGKAGISDDGQEDEGEELEAPESADLLKRRIKSEFLPVRWG